MTGTLDHVAFDIETTGLDAGDQVTVVGFELELGCRVCYQTGGRDVDSTAVETAVQDRTGTHVTRRSERYWRRCRRSWRRDSGRLSSLAQRYCSTSDFDVKSLTPTADSVD